VATSDAVARALGNVLLTTGHAGRVNSGLIPVWPRNNDQGAWDLGFRPVADLAATLRDADVVYIVAADPAGDDPALAAALDQAGFVIVQDLFLTETARRADVILPAQAYIERSGTYTSGERRVQRFYPAVPAVAGPMPDFAITAALARAFDLPLEASSAMTVFRQLAEAVPAYRGLTPEALSRVEPQYPPVGRDAIHYAGTAYPNKQGLGVQVPNAIQRGEAVEPFDVPDLAAPTAGDGLLAVPITRLYDRGLLVSQSKTLRPRLLTEPTVWVHPETAARLGLGEQAQLEVAGFTGRVAVRQDEAVPVDVVLVPRSVGIPLARPQAARLVAAEAVTP